MKSEGSFDWSITVLINILNFFEILASILLKCTTLIAYSLLYSVVDTDFRPRLRRDTRPKAMMMMVEGCTVAQ